MPGGGPPTPTASPGISSASSGSRRCGDLGTTPGTRRASPTFRVTPSIPSSFSTSGRRWTRRARRPAPAAGPSRSCATSAGKRTGSKRDSPSPQSASPFAPRGPRPASGDRYLPVAGPHRHRGDLRSMALPELPDTAPRITRRAAMLLIVTEDGGLLLHRRDDKPEIPNPDCWAGFGGAVEDGETVEDAVRREVSEETGLQIADPIFLTEAVDHEGDGRTVSLFYIVGEGRPEDIDLNEGAGVGVHRIEDLPNLKMTPFVRRAIYSHLLPVIATASAGATDDLTTELTGFMAACERAANSHDVSRVLPLIAEDATYWFTDGSYRGREEIAGALARTFATIHDEVYEITEVEWVALTEELAAC